jgi:hypothetical protein
MVKYNLKEKVFKTWDELYFLLEIISSKSNENEIILEIMKIQVSKKESWELFYDRKVWNPINEIELQTDNSNLLKSLIMKWEELIIESYFYLQQARKSGGTLSHKIGPIWSFHKKEKEKYENEILKINFSCKTTYIDNNTLEIVEEPKKVIIAPELKDFIKNKTEEESQVIIHLYLNFSGFSKIRIWKSTFLIPHKSEKKINFVHAENISLYPDWTYCKKGEKICTIIFRGLPKDCTEFDLFEEIPEPGGFYIPNIKRNNLDVYHLKVNYKE